MGNGQESPAPRDSHVELHVNYSFTCMSNDIGELFAFSFVLHSFACR